MIAEAASDLELGADRHPDGNGFNSGDAHGASEHTVLVIDIPQIIALLQLAPGVVLALDFVGSEFDHFLYAVFGHNNHAVEVGKHKVAGRYDHLAAFDWDV